MNRKKIIIGNWKMNKNKNEINNFIKNFNSFNNNKIKNNLIYGIAAPFIYIPLLFNGLKNANFKICAQDVSFNNNGAYTGQISVSMLKDYNVSYCIVGHSERRKYNYETNLDVNNKAKILLENNIVPIICVGETLEQYEDGVSKQVIKKQVTESIKDLNLSKIVIAYEPIWAIGTGKVASNKYAQDMCNFIRSITNENILIQYGGSVNKNNINELLSENDVDGALVGGASIEFEDFIDLIKKT